MPIQVSHGDGNENFSSAGLDIQAQFEPIDKLFVYGSLMSGRSACQPYLVDEGCERVGPAFLSGYHLHDLGSYPAIVAAPANTACVLEPVALVAGEVFTITDAALRRIDQYEGEGGLYRRQPVVVQVDGRPQIAWTYVYLHPIEPGRLVPLGKQPWFRGCLEENANTSGLRSEQNVHAGGAIGERYVWYAAYGSNCLFDRFRCYIEGGQFRKLPKIYSGCMDQALPLADRPYELPYDMYFAKFSRENWKSSVCFLDPTNPGHAYGRVFLVTVEQFREIHRQEGRSDEWYGHELTLGELDGIPVRTFTNRNRLDGVAPSVERLSGLHPEKNYLDVVRKGLLETWGDQLGKAGVERYLKACVERP